MALLVAVATIIGGVLYMKQQQQKQAMPKKRGPKKKSAASTNPPSHTSPKIVKKTARGTGSVQTPAGRRSARIARKSME